MFNRTILLCAMIFQIGCLQQKEQSSRERVDASADTGLVVNRQYCSFADHIDYRGYGGVASCFWTEPDCNVALAAARKYRTITRTPCVPTTELWCFEYNQQLLCQNTYANCMRNLELMQNSGRFLIQDICTRY